MMSQMHNVAIFDADCYVDEGSLQDFIDLFFAGRPSSFNITIHSTRTVGRSGLRGQHRVKSGTHLVEVFASEIDAAVKQKIPVGGNSTVPLSVKHGVHLVLAHELRHAYQAVIHGNGIHELHRGRYSGRPGEVDARRHVDENYSAITEFLDLL